MGKIIEVKDLSLIYQSEKSEVKALEDISFSVDEGEFVSVIGPSGCGKSTLLSIIAGLLKPTKGKVKLGEKGEVSTGYMLQRDCLFPWRTIISNCLLPLEIEGNKNKKSEEFVSDLLKKYGLWEFRNSYPGELSGGMRQRAALIRTLSKKPQVLLLDEPFSALDYQTRLGVNDDIYKIIKNENKTALMVSHDISEAIAMSDRVIVLTRRPGRVKNIYDISFGDKRESPLSCREKSQFKDYFNEIWRDIDAKL